MSALVSILLKTAQTGLRESTSGSAAWHSFFGSQSAWASHRGTRQTEQPINFPNTESSCLQPRVLPVSWKQLLRMMTATTRGLEFAGYPDPLQKGDHPSDTPRVLWPTPFSSSSASLLSKRSTHLSVDSPQQEGKLSGWRACNVPTRNLICSQSPGCLSVLWIIHSFHKLLLKPGCVPGVLNCCHG